MIKHLIILPFIVILFSSCGTVKEQKSNLIYSDTIYFRQLDTSFINATLMPKYVSKFGNKLDVVVPFLPLDTNLPVKNKAGKTIGKAKVKMEQNSEGNIDFDAEIEQDIDSIPKITNFVQVAKAEEKGFWSKLGDNVLDFLNIIFLILGAVLVYGLVCIKKYFDKKNKV